MFQPQHVFEYPPNKKRCIYCGYEQPPWSQAPMPPCRLQGQPPMPEIDTKALDQAVRTTLPFRFSREAFLFDNIPSFRATTLKAVRTEYRRILDQRRQQNARGRGDTDLSAIF